MIKIKSNKVLKLFSLKTCIYCLMTILLLSCYSSIDINNIIVDSTYYNPIVEHKNVAIIFLGGSDGKMPIYEYDNFTSEGYPCLSLGYFNTPNTPTELSMIPLEYFKNAIDQFKKNPDVIGKKIVIFGTSKGGELALLLGSKYKEINGVIANVPSSVVFQGLKHYSWSRKSSWSYKGKPIPFVQYAYKMNELKNIQYPNYLKMHLTSLEDEDSVNKALIKVENIHGPILLLSGEDDVMWPSAKMCDDIVTRLKQYDFKYKFDHFKYEKAGHLFYYGNPKYFGGTTYNNYIAKKDANIQIMKFLEELSSN